MNIIKNSIILGLFSLTLTAYGQDFQEQKRMNVVIEGDPRIEKLIETYDALKKEDNKVSVYRVQVFSGERENATKALNFFQKRYYDQYSNIVYDQPNFKVKVGAFRTKNDAENFIKTLDKDYKSAFILTEDIEYDEFVKIRLEQPNQDEDSSDDYDYDE